MKPVLAWMKANLTIVILSAVILLILPAAFVGTQMWNKHIRTKRQAEVDKAVTELNGLKISYAIPPTTPTGTATMVALDAPNAAVTAFFKEHRAKLEGEIAKVADAAKSINSRGHGPLVEGVFVTPPAPAPGPDGQPAPDATPVETRVEPYKALELAEKVVGKPGAPSVYELLLKSINAGDAADPAKVAEALNDEAVRFADQVRAQANRDKLTNEEQAELNKKLTAIRLGMYQAHAAGLSVYATTDCLSGMIPAVIPPGTLDADTCFRWQYDYWLVSDLFKAIDAANTDESGRRTTLPSSVVKRVESVRFTPAMAATEASVTGRANSAENKLYDVRHATVTVIASSARLPALVNAISRTNFMSVIGLEVSEAKPWEDLQRGYYYGTEHVVRAVIKIETIWLRSWTEPLMPQSFKDALAGIATEAAAAPAAAAPVSSRGARPPADDEGRAPPRRGAKGGG